MGGVYSNWRSAGSILGSLHLLMYINDATDYIKHNSTIALYADDSKLFRSIKQQSDHIFLQLIRYGFSLSM
jgi:hypothetical protein